MGDSAPHSDVTEEFRIDEELSQGGTSVFALSGDLDLYVAGDLRDRLAEAVDAGTMSLVLDLSGVTFVDSMGLGVLLGGLKRLRAKGGELRLVVPGAEIRRIFEITLLDRVFVLDATRAESLAALEMSGAS